MSLSLAEIRAVVAEARPWLVGGRLQNAWDAGPASVVLSFYARRVRRHLLLCAQPQFSRLHLVPERPAGTGEVSGFVRAVRQTLRGRCLGSLEVMGEDRVVELAFGASEEPAGRLVAELTGRSSNLYLLAATGAIVASLRSTRKSDRPLQPGQPYRSPGPPPPSAAAHRDRFSPAVEAGEAQDVSQAVHRHYGERESQDRIRSLRQALTSRLRAARKRTARLLANLEADRAKAEEAERLRLYGELLKIHLRQVPPRQSRVVLPNLFAPGSPEVAIPLKPNLSPRRNMERYFRRYKKLQAASERAERRRAEARAELDAIDAQFAAVQAASTIEELEALEKGAAHVPARPPPRRKSSGPRRFLSAEGLEILVGRTNEENEELTFRLARGNDTWLHVEGYTGSHVVIRTPRGKSVPLESLLDAATLAIHFSQLRQAGGPVAYCHCKYVTKPRGAGPGQVLYSQSKTLRVEVEPERLGRLMEGGAG
ncbi:MAG: NFACT family protein [Candidatus Brocadiia bacterium]